MQIVRPLLAGVLAALCATAAHAQKKPVDTVEVRFESRSCRGKTPQSIVIFDERSKPHEHPLRLEEGRWVWDAKPTLYTTENVYARAIFADGKTDCSTPADLDSDPDKPARRVMVFNFSTCSEPLHTVTITATKPIDVGYSRDLPKMDGKWSTACGEPLTRSSAAIKVEELWISGETLQLQLADVPAPLFIVSGTSPYPLLILSPKDGATVVFNPEAQKYAKRSGDLLRRDDIVHAIGSQWWALAKRYGPNFLDNNNEKLQKAGLKTLVVKVK